MTPVRKIFLIAGISAFAIAALITIYFLYSQLKEKEADIAVMEEIAALEKEQLEDEYENLAMQFDGYGMNIQNDSLVELLSQEQQRVRDLLEELRITKATDARKIQELKKELATVREVMKSYVAQIDSLDRQNKQLTAENKEVKRQYDQVSQKAQTLEQERAELTEVVTRASMLEVTNFAFKGVNDRGREKKHIKYMKTLQFDYTVQKNITTKPGLKTIYLQIRRPNGEVLVENAANTFAYENQQIPYSITKEFEYTGDEYNDVMYWTIQEVLEPGIYNADFFIDGNLCGSFAFELHK